MDVEIQETIDDLRTLSHLQAPYLYDWAHETIKRVSVEDVIHILETEAEGIRYFTDDDGVDGGMIERMAIQFGKRLPEDNNFDMRDYYSFIISGAGYYVFFIDEWPDK